MIRGAGIQGKQNSSGKTVEFLFPDARAKRVSLAGEFNGWNPDSLPMNRTPEGMWKTAIALDTGRYEFKPQIEGAWVKDQPCRVLLRGRSFQMDLKVALVPNIFGTRNWAVWIR